MEAKAEAQASMEAWNVSLSELNNPENDEDAVAFEKLMYRMGLAHMKAEDKEAMKPLAVDNAHEPLVKRKKKGWYVDRWPIVARRRRRARRRDDHDSKAHSVLHAPHGRLFTAHARKNLP